MSRCGCCATPATPTPSTTPERDSSSRCVSPRATTTICAAISAAAPQRYRRQRSRTSWTSSFEPPGGARSAMPSSSPGGARPVRANDNPDRSDGQPLFGRKRRDRHADAGCPLAKVRHGLRREAPCRVLEANWLAGNTLTPIVHQVNSVKRRHHRALFGLARRTARDRRSSAAGKSIDLLGDVRIVCFQLV
jgi:hypothetical protein